MSENKSLNAALAAATCTLLGAAAPVCAADQEVDRWSFDTALLYYGESEDRVTDASAAISARRDFDDERILGLTVTADTLTGASPSGAVASGSAQTFTSPSGLAVYTTPAEEIPLDDTFLDTRYALNVNWTQPLARLYSFSGGLGFSTEYDYTHLGAQFSLARDFNKRNTTVSIGAAWSQDDLDPVGGAPLPLSQMLDVGDHTNKLGDDSKDVLDLLLGVTQTLGRNTVLRVNYSFSQSDGYLNDPYKFLSVVDPLTGEPIARAPAPGFAGPSGVYRYESRPDTRAKHSLYTEVKHAFGQPVLRAAYRFMTDDWSIDSHTLETALRWPIGAASFIEPHLRYYTQSEAEFYRLALLDGQPLPEFASADYRLGNFDAVTVGLKFGHRMTSGSEWSTRLEYYMQSGEAPSEQVIGNQRGRELYPDMDAVIVQFSYRFKL